MMTKPAAAFVFLLALSVRCVASGYGGDLADAWSQSSIVVLGCPKIVRGSDKETLQAERGTCSMEVLRAYKGAKAGDRIEFLDPFFQSSAGLCIQEGSNYVVFLQTINDRKRRPHSATENLGTVLTGLRALKVTDAALKEIEAGIATITAYETLAPQDRKAFLLKNLSSTNLYSHPLILREVLTTELKDAIPYFQQQLAQATNAPVKLALISCLRRLGDPDVPDEKSIVLSWLASDSGEHRVEIIEQMVHLKDASVIPTIRRYINADDALVVAAARSGLLRLGDPDGKRLCLDMILKDTAPYARYNAIHYLNWGYSGHFTEEERTIIRRLTRDKDPSIARVAGFIVEKWQSVSIGIGTPLSERPSHTTNRTDRVISGSAAY
jgi:hypothetical protein